MELNDVRNAMKKMNVVRDDFIKESNSVIKRLEDLNNQSLLMDLALSIVRAFEPENDPVVDEIPDEFMFSLVEDWDVNVDLDVMHMDGEHIAYVTTYSDDDLLDLAVGTTAIQENFNAESRNGLTYKVKRSDLEEYISRYL